MKIIINNSSMTPIYEQVVEQNKGYDPERGAGGRRYSAICSFSIQGTEKYPL